MNGMSADTNRKRRSSLQLAMRAVASDRRCPKCERKNALGREMGDSAASIKKCRYCGHVRFFDLMNDGVTTPAQQEDRS